MPAKITPLRPAPAAPARSPERQMLADAIARYDRVAEALARLDAGLAALRSGAPYAAHEAAEAALADAKLAAPQRLVAEALGEAVPGGQSVADAEKALAEAAAALATHRAAIREVETRRAAAEAEAARAADRRADAVRAVVVADPATARLVAAFGDAQRRLTDLRRAVLGLSLPQGVATDFALDYMPPWPDLPTAPLWRAAVSALRDDPDSPLPE